MSWKKLYKWLWNKRTSKMSDNQYLSVLLEENRNLRERLFDAEICYTVIFDAEIKKLKDQLSYNKTNHDKEMQNTMAKIKILQEEFSNIRLEHHKSCMNKDIKIEIISKELKELKNMSYELKLKNENIINDSIIMVNEIKKSSCMAKQSDIKQKKCQVHLDKKYEYIKYCTECLENKSEDTRNLEYQISKNQVTEMKSNLFAKRRNIQDDPDKRNLKK